MNCLVRSLLFPCILLYVLPTVSCFYCAPNACTNDGCLGLSLREWFWRDVATAAGHVEDMMRNNRQDEVPGFETEADAMNARSRVPDTHDFARHSAFAPVFTSGLRRRRRRNGSVPRHPENFPGGGNPGVQVDGELLNRPMHGVNAASPWSLPPWAPNHYIWAFRTGNLAWTPHPQFNPSIPHPLSPWSAISLTGGHPLPGTMPQWTPGTWPPLDHHHPRWERASALIRLSPYVIPNPNNAHLPQIYWNVTRHPSTARRLTANHVVVELGGVWEHPVTDVGAQMVMVTCDVGYMSTLWGPVVVDQTAQRGHGHGQGWAVTVRDLFEAIYRYFQVPLTDLEAWYVCELHPSNYDRLTDAYRERCWESNGLEGWEGRQGFRRADVLGDRKYWWGVWVSTWDRTWWLNLGLMNPAHRVPGGL